MSSALFETEFFKLLSKQFLILRYVKEKLDILNYCCKGAEDGSRLLSNRFFIFNSQVYYRSLIIDFCALLGSGRNDKHSFHTLKKHLHELDESSSIYLEDFLEEYNYEKSPLKELKELRDGSVAHYDFRDEALYFNFDYLNQLNELFIRSHQLLTHLGSTMKTPFFFASKPSTELGALDRLVTKYTSTDPNGDENKRRRLLLDNDD